VPWAYAYSTWYHQYPQYPREALRAAAALQEYTLIDKGAFLSADVSVQEAVQVFIMGTDDACDKLLNPARVLRSAYTIDEALAKEFMAWMRSDKGGQEVVRNFAVRGNKLYSEAPRDTE
jgi:ABC-type tungstate transport system permease subunit